MPSRLFIADDSTIVRRLMRESLTGAGFEVCGEAENGVITIEKVQQLKPDLLLIDMLMPKMNGPEAISVLKKLMPQMSIVVMTLHEERVGKSLLAGLKVDLIVPKNEGVKKIIDGINSVLESRVKSGSNGLMARRIIAEN
jgi:two-component system chemotaxis response regulator CheY